MYWGLLAHLGYNMWDDRPESVRVQKEPYVLKSDTLRFDRPLWDELTASMAAVGMDLVVIDVAEGMRYQSHPELAVRGSWSPEELNAEVRRLKGLGILAIPKLNFSASHDAWLGDYQFMISSPTYYRVCADLIAEVADAFDHPPFFHVGMDEETVGHQRNRSQAVIRQHELWYHDLNFFATQAQKAGARPWMWSDRLWWHEQEFLDNVSRDILQSNWYYFDQFSFPEDEPGFSGEPQLRWTRVHAYDLLDRHGFDQIPCGGNYNNPDNPRLTVEYCRRVLSPERFLGYMSAPWHPTVEHFRHNLFDAVEQIGAEIARGDRDPSD